MTLYIPKEIDDIIYKYIDNINKQNIKKELNNTNYKCDKCEKINNCKLVKYKMCNNCKNIYCNKCIEKNNLYYNTEELDCIKCIQEKKYKYLIEKILNIKIDNNNRFVVLFNNLYNYDLMNYLIYRLTQLSYEKCNKYNEMILYNMIFTIYLDIY